MPILALDVQYDAGCRWVVAQNTLDRAVTVRVLVGSKRVQVRELAQGATLRVAQVPAEMDPTGKVWVDLDDPFSVANVGVQLTAVGRFLKAKRLGGGKNGTKVQVEGSGEQHDTGGSSIIPQSARSLEEPQSMGGISVPATEIESGELSISNSAVRGSAKHAKDSAAKEDEEDSEHSEEEGDDEDEQEEGDCSGEEDEGEEGDEEDDEEDDEDEDEESSSEEERWVVKLIKSKARAARDRGLAPRGTQDGAVPRIIRQLLTRDLRDLVDDEDDVEELQDALDLELLADAWENAETLEELREAASELKSDLFFSGEDELPPQVQAFVATSSAEEIAAEVLARLTARYRAERVAVHSRPACLSVDVWEHWAVVSAGWQGSAPTVVCDKTFAEGYVRAPTREQEMVVARMEWHEADKVALALDLDTTLNALSLQQLNFLRDTARAALGSDYDDATMVSVNIAVLQPACEAACVPYARVLNPQGKVCTVFVSHAWGENFDAFVESLNDAFPTTIVGLWICATALYQTTRSELISKAIGTDPRSAPFTVALRSVDCFCVVRNAVADIYTRIWCCWEAFLANELKLLVPAKLKVVGPQNFPEVVDIEEAQASSKDDLEMILNVIREEPGMKERVNHAVNEIKMVRDELGMTQTFKNFGRDNERRIADLEVVVDDLQFENTGLRTQLQDLKAVVLELSARVAGLEGKEKKARA
mmetsp:Transcript_98095/g.225033  ORF Transcript_98095/g.225033 Transcript_98095/m.225033 type:complete len:706 (-) Transcript_98095:250-2367(-)